MLSAEAWLSRFAQQLELQEFSELSIPDYVRNIRRFLDYLKDRGIGRLTEVDRRILTDYQLEVSLERFRGKPLHSSTKRKRLTCVRQFFRYLLQQSAVLQDPTSELEFPPLLDQLPRDVLTKREMGRLLSAADPQNLLGLRDRSMLELLYSTGIRVSELASLNVQNLDLRNAELRVRGKRNKERIVPLGEVAREYLGRYLSASRPYLAPTEEPALFLSLRGKRFHYTNISFLVRSYGRRAGIRKRVSPHGLRHTCATHLLQGRADIRHIQRILGHASIATTQRYTRVEITDLKKVLKRCHPREQHQIKAHDD